MDLSKVIGLKIVAIKGDRGSGRKKKFYKPAYILFSDKKTYIWLSEQDPYSYHDCDFSATHIYVGENQGRWEEILNYPDANVDL